MWVFDGGWLSLVVASVIIATIIGMISRKEIKSGRVKRVLKLNFVFLYFLIVASSYFNDWYLQHELAKFDLDGDGFFSQAEMTSQQQELFNLVMHDTGNNLVLITSAVYSAFVTFLLYITLRVKCLSNF
jgi:hypothetical protein